MQRRKSLALSIPYQLDFFKQYKFLSKDKPQHILLESGRGGRLLRVDSQMGKELDSLADVVTFGAA
ncbi:hypothetical protein ACT4UT_02070, partial [Bacillus sp. B-TM1]